MKIKEGGGMDIQKEREAFQKFCEENFDFENHEQTYFDEQTQCYESDIGEDTESINMAWMAWQAAKAQAVLEGFVLVPKYHQQNIRDALVIACDVQEDEQRFEDSLNYVHKAMIEAQEPAND